MQIPVEKNKEYIVDIVDYGYEGEGIAKIDNYIIFISGAMKQEKVKIHIVKVLTSYAYGKIVEIIEESPYREESDCNSFVRCGGCDLRHIDYEETLNIKQEKVQNLMDKSLKTKVDVEKTVGMGNPFHYRNKAQYPFGTDKEKNAVTGIYAKRSHNIIPLNNCKIQNPLSEEIAKYIQNFVQENSIPTYNEKTQKGILRHVVVKIGIQTDEVMCILVVNKEKIQHEEKLVQELLEHFPNIKTIVKNINDKNTNVILGRKNINLYGDGYIYDRLGKYTFKISPLSFYQVNPIQTEALYNIAIEMANIEKDSNKTAFDLYCGIGTISIFLSEYFSKIYGIEIVEDAIKDAKENAKMNNINNIDFIVGDVEYALEELIKKENKKADIVFVDPPRKGLDKNTIQNLMEISPEKIIYISCNPATLARDLGMLEEKYTINKIQPVDMFPFTSHVESVAMLGRREND